MAFPGANGNLEQKKQQSLPACLQLFSQEIKITFRGVREAEKGTLAILQCQAYSSVHRSFLPGPAGPGVGFIPPPTSVFMDIFVYTQEGKQQDINLPETDVQNTRVGGEQRRNREWEILPESFVKHE